MLAASEFSVGTVGDATPLSLVLPRADHESTGLVGRTIENEGPALFLLDDQHRFRWFECSNNQDWAGILVPNVQVEVDETSIFHPDYERLKAGCVVRQSTQLIAIAETSSSYSTSRTDPVILIEGLAPSSQRAAFSRWQISLGQGTERRVLHTVDANT